jgi:hypothetical protein
MLTYVLVSIQIIYLPGSTWHSFVVRYPNSLILNLFVRSNFSVVFVGADCARVRSVSTALLSERTEVVYDQFSSRKSLGIYSICFIGWDDGAVVLN